MSNIQNINEDIYFNEAAYQAKELKYAKFIQKQQDDIKHAIYNEMEKRFGGEGKWMLLDNEELKWPDIKL